ncbi:MAG: septum formation family protein [Propionibacteriaceae bacterium]|nr:septum formation family protein [Propionibacteriaceae bacterium]
MKLRKLVVLVAGFAVATALGGCSLLGLTDHRDPDGHITASTNVNPFALRVGDCLITVNLDSNVATLPVVPCSDAHNAEVFHMFDLPDGAFDEPAIRDAADTVCYQVVEEYVGPRYYAVSSGGLKVFFFIPSAASWDNGDRSVSCLAATVSDETELTSSIRGQGA